MARKAVVPSQQLERLKELYNQEREALAALATAQGVVTSAESRLDAAQRALSEAQSGVDVAYQALVALVGAGVAAELTGRNRSAGRSGRGRHAAGGNMPQAEGGDGRDDQATPRALVGGALE